MSATVISAVWLGTPVLPVDIVGMLMIMTMMVLVTQRGESTNQPVDAYEGSVDDLPPFEGRASLLGYYRTRPAVHDDFVRFQEILADGHETLAALGVDEKKSKTYPSERRVMRAIDWKTAYVVTLSDKNDEMKDADERIIGVFALNPDGDEAYAHAMNASWLSESPEPPDKTTYAALHWVTVAAEARRRGVGMFILGEADRLARAAGKTSVRCDTYQTNNAMRALLVAFGFTPCGEIILFDRLGRARRRATFERMW